MSISHLVLRKEHEHAFLPKPLLNEGMHAQLHGFLYKKVHVFIVVGDGTFSL